MLEGIKKWMWKRRLSQEEKQVKRRLASKTFSNARKIGLMGFVENEEDQKKLEEYMHKLQNQGKEVYMLVFTASREVPHFCMPKLSVDYVPAKLVNWYQVPQGKAVKEFRQKPFDILIDLCLVHRPEHLFVSATSAASMKIGLYGKSMVRYYDFMISTKPSGHNAFEQYVRSIEKYLSQINPTNHE